MKKNWAAVLMASVFIALKSHSCCKVVSRRKKNRLVQYQGMLQMFNDKPVTLRTLIVGRDKQLPYMPISEENPCLGWRGICITLDQPEICHPGAGDAAC